MVLTQRRRVITATPHCSLGPTENITFRTVRIQLLIRRNRTLLRFEPAKRNISRKFVCIWSMEADLGSGDCGDSEEESSTDSEPQNFFLLRRQAKPQYHLPPLYFIRRKGHRSSDHHCFLHHYRYTHPDFPWMT